MRCCFSTTLRACEGFFALAPPTPCGACSLFFFVLRQVPNRCTLRTYAHSASLASLRLLPVWWRVIRRKTVVCRWSAVQLCCVSRRRGCASDTLNTLHV